MRILVVLFLCSSLGPAAVLTGRESLTDERTPAESIGVVTEGTPAVEPRALAVPEKIAEGLAIEPEQWLDELAIALTGGLESDSVRVRAIHDWVTLNVSYDTASLSSGDAGSQGVADVLRAGRSACGGYANLFGELCRLAGVDCVTIQGPGRGTGFRVFGPESPRVPDHAWNAVMVDGRWRLVDATWDAGRYRDEEGYKQHYSTDYLFPDPAWFVHTHFPADPSWQLLDQPVSAIEFAGLPYLTGEFFRLGLRLGTALGLVSDAMASFPFELAVPEDVSVFCRLLTPSGEKTGRPIDGVRSGDNVVFSVPLPPGGDWVVGVFAKPGGPDGEYTGVALLGVRSAPRPNR